MNPIIAFHLACIKAGKQEIAHCRMINSLCEKPITYQEYAEIAEPHCLPIVHVFAFEAFPIHTGHNQTQ